MEYKGKEILGKSEHTGIKEKFPKNYLGQLVVPLLPRTFVKKYLSRK